MDSASLNTAMEPQKAKLQQVCRICLLHYKGTMTDIHHKPEKSCRIRDVLLTCVPLQISEGDKFPRFICSPCLTRLQTASQFRSIALQNDKYLNTISSMCAHSQIENLPVTYEKKISATRVLYKPIIKFPEVKNGNASDKNILRLSNHSNTIDKHHRPDENNPSCSTYENNEAASVGDSQNKGIELPAINHNTLLATLLHNDTITSDKENDQTSQQNKSNANDLQVCEIITIDDDEDIPQQSEVSVTQNQTVPQEKTISAVDLEQMRLRVQDQINNKIMELTSTINNSQSPDRDHNVNINEQNRSILQRQIRNSDTLSISAATQQKKTNFNNNNSLKSRNEKQNTDKNNLIQSKQKHSAVVNSVINHTVSKAHVTAQISSATNSIAMGFQHNNNVNKTQPPNYVTTGFQQTQNVNKTGPPNYATTDFSQNQNVNRIQQPVPVTASFQQTQNVSKTQPPNYVTTGFQQIQTANKTQPPNYVTTGFSQNQNVNRTQQSVPVTASFQQTQNVSKTQPPSYVTTGFQQSQVVNKTQQQAFQENQNVNKTWQAVMTGKPTIHKAQQQLPVTTGFQHNRNVSTQNTSQLQTQLNAVASSFQHNRNVNTSQHLNSVAVGFQQNQNAAQLQTQISSATSVFQPNQKSAVYNQTQLVLPTSLQNQNIARANLCQAQSGISTSQQPLPQIQSTNLTLNNQNVNAGMYNVQQPRSQNNEASKRLILAAQSLQKTYYNTQNVNQTTNLINSDRQLFHQNPSTNDYFSNQVSNLSVVPSFQNVVTGTNQTQPPSLVIYSETPAVQQSQNMMFALSIQAPQQSQDIAVSQTLPYPQHNLTAAVNLQWSGQNNSVPISYATSQTSSSQLLSAQSFNNSIATAVPNQAQINASDNIPNSVLYARAQLANVNLQQNQNTSVINQSAITNTVSNINVQKSIVSKVPIPAVPKRTNFSRSSQSPKNKSVIVSPSASSLPNLVTSMPSNIVNIDTNKTHTSISTISVISPERINRNLLAGKNIGINITPPENKNPIQNAEIGSSDNLTLLASEVGITPNAQQIDNIPSSDNTNYNSTIENLNSIDNLLHSLEQAHQSPNQNTECENEYIPFTGFAQTGQKSSLVLSDIDRIDSLLVDANMLSGQKVESVSTTTHKSTDPYINDVKIEILHEKVPFYQSVNINNSNEVNEILGNRSSVVVLNAIPLQYRHLLEKIKPAPKRQNSFEFDSPVTSPDNSSDEDWIKERKRKKRCTSTSDSSDEDWIKERKRKKRCTSTSDSSDEDWIKQRTRKNKKLKKNHSLKRTRKKRRRLVFSDEESLTSDSNHKTGQSLLTKHWINTVKAKLEKKMDSNNLNQPKSDSVPNIPSASSDVSQTKETNSVPNSCSLGATNTSNVSETDSLSSAQTVQLVVISQTNSESELNTIKESTNLSVDRNIDDNESKLTMVDRNIDDNESKLITVDRNIDDKELNLTTVDQDMDDNESNLTIVHQNMDDNESKLTTVDNETKLRNISNDDVNTVEVNSTDSTVVPMIDDDDVPIEVTVNNNDLTIGEFIESTIDTVQDEDPSTIYEVIINDWDENFNNNVEGTTDEIALPNLKVDPLENGDENNKMETTDEIALSNLKVDPLEDGDENNKMGTTDEIELPNLKVDPLEDSAVEEITLSSENYKCKDCNKDFFMEEDLKKHICEFAVPKHACYKCSKRFTKIIDLQMHLGTTHCEEFQVCKKCSKVFNMLLHYLDHFCDKNATIVEHDLKDSPYNCGVCTGNFDTVESFIKHYNDLH